MFYIQQKDEEDCTSIVHKWKAIVFVKRRHMSAWLARVVYGLLRLVANYGITDQWLARVVYDLRLVANYGITDQWLARVVYDLRMVAKDGIRTAG